MRFFCSLLFSIIITSCFLLTANAQTKRKLVWHDEFNYKGLPNSAKWNYDTGGKGWGNQELQYYTYQSTKNARVENGHLIIEARKETVGNNAYTAARLVTKNKGDWTFGRIEVRAKLPKGLGTWPAIWMLGSTHTPLKWPEDGEIDIMEHVGYDPGVIHASLHCKNCFPDQSSDKTATTPIPDCSDAFHVYSLVWTTKEMTIFVDNRPYFTAKMDHQKEANWPFASPFHLLLNVAVGGTWGGVKGIDDTIFPQQMIIDYVRVYQ